MKAIHKNALIELGYTPETYTVQRDGLVSIWGLALNHVDDSLSFVVEHTPRAHGGSGKYVVRVEQSRPGTTPYAFGAYKTQREAIAEGIRARYGL